MKVLLTHRYFYPDRSPYGVILRQISKELADAGHEVSVFTSLPSYGREPTKAPRHESLGNVHVRRIWVLSEASRNPLARVINVFIYCISLFFFVLRSRADIVTACSFPPVVAGWSASLAAKLSGASFIYHVQDIHPEVSIYSGGLQEHGLPARLLKALDNQTLKRASAIVTLSHDMASTLRARGLMSLPITVMNNPALEAKGETVAPPTELIKPQGMKRVIFAGNLGRFQNLPLLAEGIAKCLDNHPKLELMFLGDGVALDELKERWAEHSQVRFAPFLPLDQALGVIRSADIGLVSLNANIYRVAYPSKLSTYLNLGLRVLALVEPESQMAQDLHRQGVGAVPQQANPESIAAALEALLASTPNDVAYAQENMTWPALIASLENPKNK